MADEQETGRSPSRGGRALTQAARRAGAATSRAAGYTYRQARRASSAQGAGETGLYRLIELHAFSAAGDAAVAVSLAGTLFFQVPTGEARLQVAQFLALTMLPFAIVAPLVGPLLDRVAHGRRWAIGSTMALRAFLAWVLAGAVLTDSAVMFPAALGVLVASKAYGVTRASAVPRLLPESLTLVKANARISLAGVVGAAVSAPLAALAAHFGPDWALRYAFVVFVAATILAILLPARVDSAQGEERLPRRVRARIPGPVVQGLRSNAGLRLLSGFLTMFMAFLLRDQPFPGWEDRPELLLGLVIGAAGVGGTLGVAVGSIARSAPPEVTVVATLLVDAVVAVAAAVFYGLPTAVLLGLTAGLAQTLGKLSLDALVQREVPERTRTSAFARTETLLQLSWVFGGLLGLAMPLNARLGLGVAAAILVLWAGFVLQARRRA
ncbi:MAG TPA: MFS transporter [Nocardioidaceae bacterium]